MDMEIVAGILVGLLALASVAAMVIGVLGSFAGLHLMRCAQCGHMAFTTTDRHPQECGYCRHPHLTHLGLDLLRTRPARSGRS